VPWYVPGTQAEQTPLYSQTNGANMREGRIMIWNNVAGTHVKLQPDWGPDIHHIYPDGLELEIRDSAYKFVLEHAKTYLENGIKSLKEQIEDGYTKNEIEKDLEAFERVLAFMKKCGR
jgi:hypothetical protein